MRFPRLIVDELPAGYFIACKNSVWGSGRPETDRVQAVRTPDEDSGGCEAAAGVVRYDIGRSILRWQGVRRHRKSTSRNSKTTSVVRQVPRWRSPEGLRVLVAG